MSRRLAGEFTLLSVAAVSLRAVWENLSLQGAIESAVRVGLVAWAAGFVAGEILRKLAIEHVAAEAAEGVSPPPADATAKPPRTGTPSG